MQYAMDCLHTHAFDFLLKPLTDAQLMAAAVSPGAFSVPMPEQVKNALRAKILRAMLLSIAQRRGE